MEETTEYAAGSVPGMGDEQEGCRERELAWKATKMSRHMSESNSYSYRSAAPFLCGCEVFTFLVRSAWRRCYGQRDAGAFGQGAGFAGDGNGGGTDGR